MGIPARFYLRYWLINSLMAAALGFILCMAIPLILLIGGPIWAVLLYQVSAYRHFWGREKGHFEYYYREYLLDQSAKLLIQRTIGVPEILWDYPGQYYPRILESLEVKADPGLQSVVFLKIAQTALKEYDCRKEIEYLRKAVAARPADLVANCRLASAMERVGNAAAAISTYQAALTDPSLNSAELRQFIAAQIKRVETQGPTKKPPMPGLSRMSY